MTKIFRNLLIFLTFTQGLFATSSDFVGSSTDSEQQSNKNQLRRVLSELLPKVRVELNEDDTQVTLTGTPDNLESARKVLQNYDTIRSTLIPTGKAANLTTATLSPLESWDQFMLAVGIAPELNNLFDTKAECTHDDGERFTIVTESSYNGRMVTAYVDSLHENSAFFAWARRNVPNFIEQNQSRTSICYGLLRDFLHLEAGEIAEESSDSDNATLVLDAQNVLKNMIAAVSSNVALKPTSDPKRFSVHTLSLGEGYNARSATLKLILDKSGSMHGNPISFVNDALPKVLAIVQNTLKSGQAIDVEIETFNEHKTLVGTYVLTPQGRIPSLAPIQASGATNLTLILPSLTAEENEEKLVVAFTDGDHTSTKSLKVGIANLKRTVRTKPFARARLVKVGGSESDFFKAVSDILGGEYATEDNIEDFFKTLQADLTDMLRSRAPLVLELAGAGVKVEWLPDDRPGIYSTRSDVTSGDRLKYKNVPFAIDPVEFISHSPTPSAASSIIVITPEATPSMSPRELLEAQIAELQKQLAALS